MTIVFTLCSANYLAHAKTLGDSLREHNPDCRFVIGLVDRIPKQLTSSFWHPYELVPVEQLGIPGFWDLVQKYDVVELNTAVKPFYLEYFYERDRSVDAVIYLDPDILVCASFRSLLQKLRTFNIVVTPHSCTYDDSAANIYYETGMLTTGIYNLGFLATSGSATTSAFLRWWQKRVRDHCYFQQGSGIFVDQLWVTLAPLYFSGVHVETDPGYNMCYWNHFERRLSQQDGKYFVNDQHELVFYHFSSYSPARPDEITTRVKPQKISFAERPDLRPIYDDYCKRLLASNYYLVTKIPWSIPRTPPRSELTPKRATKESVRAVLRALPVGLQRGVKRAAQVTMDSLK